MFKYCLFFVSAFCCFSSCKTNKTAAETYTPQGPVMARYIRHYYDSEGGAEERYVFTKKSNDDIVIYSRNGLPLREYRSEPPRDSAGYVSREITDSAVITAMTFTWQNKVYRIEIDPTGEIRINGPECSKPGKNMKSLWPDTVNLAIWYSLEKRVGLLTVYSAVESPKYPYYYSSTKDSVVYMLNAFCKAGSIGNKVDAAANQALFNRLVRVNINPNPFTDKFELTLRCDKIGFMLQNEEKIIHFYDDKGQLLLEKVIDLDKPEVFAFPLVKTGTVISYDITWGVYKISGKVAKA